MDLGQPEFWKRFRPSIKTISSHSLDTIHIGQADFGACPVSVQFSHRHPLLATSTEFGSMFLTKFGGFGGDLEHCRTRVCSSPLFGLCWSSDDAWIFLGSGDQNVGQWDVERQTMIRVIKGHSASVTNISSKPETPSEIASGGRDGNVFLWDLASPSERPIKRIFNENQSSTRQSVTGLCFLGIHNHILASTNAPFGKIYLWDTRYLNTEFCVLPHGTFGRAIHSFTSLVSNSTGTMLYGPSTDSHIYAYNTAKPNSGPARSWTCSKFKNNSFYTKVSMSPYDNMLLTGSAGSEAYLWDVEMDECYSLSGHEKAVGAVSWSCLSEMATSSDDCTVRLWRFDGGLARQNGYSAVMREPCIVNQGTEKVHPVHAKHSPKIDQFFCPLGRQ